jgi:hypothetical protein
VTFVWVQAICSPRGESETWDNMPRNKLVMNALLQRPRLKRERKRDVDCIARVRLSETPSCRILRDSHQHEHECETSMHVIVDNVHEVHEQPDPSHSSRVPYVALIA